MKNLLAPKRVNKGKIALFVTVAVLVFGLGIVVKNYGEGLLYTMTNYRTVMQLKKTDVSLTELKDATLMNIMAQTMTEANYSKEK